MKASILILLAILLLSFSFQNFLETEDKGSHFSFPINMRVGQISRFSNYTDFEWDNLTIYTVPALAEGFMETYKKIKEFDPEFYFFEDHSQILVFFLREEIVYVRAFPYRRIFNPSADSISWKLEFTREDAVFIVENNALLGYVFVPYAQ